jgi:hypothetical protein
VASVGITCGKGEFCQRPTGTCFFADLEGNCAKVPRFCIEIFMPVCGCDNKTYGNDCERMAHRVSMAHDGKCF